MFREIAVCIVIVFSMAGCSFEQGAWPAAAVDSGVDEMVPVIGDDPSVVPVEPPECLLPEDCLENPWVAALEPTSTIDVAVNLNADSSEIPWELPPLQWFHYAPFSIDVIIYDGNGEPHQCRLVFVKAASGQWDWRLFLDGGSIQGEEPEDPVQVGRGELSFDNEGLLLSQSVEEPVRISFLGTQEPQEINLDFGETKDEVPGEATPTTQYAYSFATKSVHQDGHDGSGHWECTEGACVPDYGVCDGSAQGACCGDDVCEGDEGESEASCPVDCDWECEVPMDCATLDWDGVPQVTSKVFVDVNLDSNATVPVSPWNYWNPGTTSNFSEFFYVTDSLGGFHRLDLYFRKSGDNHWSWFLLAHSGELHGGTMGVPFQAINGEIFFTTDGWLESEEGNMVAVFDFLGAVGGQQVELDFGDSIMGGGLGQFQTTQYASPSTLRELTQDGHNGLGHWSCEQHECVATYQDEPLSTNPYPPGNDTGCGDSLCDAQGGETHQSCPLDCSN